jgi:hypothetical protein
MKSKIYWIILVSSGILTGLIFCRQIYNQFHLFGEFSYLVFFITLTTLLASGLIIFLITKSRSVIGLTTFAIVFFSIATITSNTFFKIAERKAINLAENIIEQLYEYRHDHGNFPKDLDSLKTNSSMITRFKKTQTYKLDKKGTSFYIFAWRDGWYDHVFYSGDSSWQLRD